MKLPRLNGADIYVARLGWKTQPAAHGSLACCAEDDANTDRDSLSRPSTGSLHDELLNPERKSKPATNSVGAANSKRPSVLSSRPCYRCISYMASVGIKRVFWTTDAGVWEGAKVRDLVDALDKLGEEKSSDATAALHSVFVTKHEVLMLRRMVGQS